MLQHWEPSECVAAEKWLEEVVSTLNSLSASYQPQNQQISDIESIIDVIILPLHTSGPGKRSITIETSRSLPISAKYGNHDIG